MENSQKFTLPSGSELKITLGSFVDCRNLYQAIASELLKVELKDGSELDVKKTLLCVGLASKPIEEAIWRLMGSVTRNGIKVDEGTFSDVKAREDYVVIMTKVAEVNLAPFTKSLLSEFYQILGAMQKDQEQKS